jgi:Asp-tRNA(Asn)/Glu-tRNA(Gln) amidotransferase A subunit family amidase
LPWPAALNPWSLDLHPGGSSSGSAVAVATGLAPGALGTDTGGSVRNPATCCGVIGMKPTYGLVSRTGVFPLSFSLDHIGPLTRTVEDNAILLGAIAGPDPADRSSPGRPLADCLEDLHAGVKGLRIGVIAHFYTEDLIGSPEQVAAITAAADVLRRLGAEVRPHHPLRRGVCRSRARPPAAAAGLRRGDPPQAAARRLHLRERLCQGATIARGAVPGIRRGDEGVRCGDHPVEPRPAVPAR